MRKEFNFHRIGLEHINMAAFSLFWNTNMAAVTSRENVLLITRHCPDLGSASEWMQILLHPIRSSTHIWVVSSVWNFCSRPQMSFRGESSSDVVKFRQFHSGELLRWSLSCQPHWKRFCEKTHRETVFSLHSLNCCPRGGREGKLR